jgi:hypothetical protein
LRKERVACSCWILLSNYYHLVVRTGIEFVGAKQFGVRHFAELLRGAHNGLVPGLENPGAVADAVDQVGDDMLTLAH